jgi:hypothetical protein
MCPADTLDVMTGWWLIMGARVADHIAICMLGVWTLEVYCAMSLKGLLRCLSCRNLGRDAGWWLIMGAR